MAKVGTISHGVLEWLAESPAIALPLVACLQLLVMATFGRLITSRFRPAAAYRIWLAIVCLSLAVIPVHRFVGGWSVKVAPISSRPADLSALARNEAVGEQSRFGQGSATLSGFEDDVARWVDPPLRSFDPSSSTSVDPVVDSGDRGASIGASSLTTPQSSQSRTFSAALRSFTEWTNRNWLMVLAIVYFGGCGLLAVRLTRAILRLRRWARVGDGLSLPLESEASRVAQQVGLSSLPMVRISSSIDMPLVFGWMRPVVLVPIEFPCWSESEWRATLLHEFTHIHRGDLLGQSFSQAMCLVYWCHPSSWWIDRKLAETREWATDRRILEGTVDPRWYGRALLSILERLAEDPRHRSAKISCGIAMAAPNKMEARLRHLMHPPSPDSLAGRLLAAVVIALLIGLTVGTTIQLEPAVAQSLNADAAETAGDQADEIADGDNDLITRIRTCEVLTVSGDQFDAIFTVSGQVVSPEGEPVAGATVVLRESSTARISSEPSNAFREDWHRQRVQDVFARTTTDQEGKFRFSEVKSPAMPEFWSNSWRGNIVAAHEDLGVGWLPLGGNQQKLRIERGLTIVLKPKASVSGRYQTPDGDPIGDGSVVVTRLVKPTDSPMNRVELDLQRSQLTPRGRTDSEGNFQFHSLPEGFAAALSVLHDDWKFSDGSMVATSDDVAQGRREELFSVYGDSEIVPSPITVTADRGFTVSGTVVRAEDRTPVSGVQVGFASTSVRNPSDDQGRFQFTAPSRWVENFRRRDEPLNLYVDPPKESGLLRRYWEMPYQELVANKPLEILLEGGTLVRGRVVTEENEPFSGASVRVPGEVLVGGTTDETGRYEFVVPRSTRAIAVTTRESGYKAPSYHEVRYATEPDERWPHVRIDAQSGDLLEPPPIVVRRAPTWTVIASLPDGTPAAGATVILQDEVVSTRPGSRISSHARVVDRSKPVMTNGIGRAELSVSGVLSEKAFVKIKLATSEQAYEATAAVSSGNDRTISVVLESAWIVEGRVLVDRQPVAGAQVSVGETRPTNTTRGMTGGFTTGNFVNVVTDREGKYRAAVSPHKQYSVSVRSLPELDYRPWISYRASRVAEGRFEVRDFGFFRGKEEIAGRVVDRQGNPTEGARVAVLPGDGVNSHFWIGHNSESQFATDADGRFHLRAMPAGSYRLRVSGPRRDGGRSRVPTLVTASTGSTELEIQFDDFQDVPEIPRLQPQRIVPIE